MNKLNNIDSILKYISSFDKSGKSTNKIDTHLEFGLLGEYLNGNIHLNIENNPHKNNIESKELKFLKKLYDSLKPNFINNNSNNENLPEISYDNIEKYEKLHALLFYKNTSSEENLLLKNFSLHEENYLHHFQVYAQKQYFFLIFFYYIHLLFVLEY